jgi:hypothetical protein
MSEAMGQNTAPALVLADPDACRMVAELMTLTGEGLESVVIGALRQAIDQAERRARFHDRIMAITRDIAGGARGGW